MFLQSFTISNMIYIFVFIAWMYFFYQISMNYV